MVRSRRPELEKDNPMAPQLYVGPRRRRTLSRAASASHAPVQDGMAAALHSLMEAAEQFVNSVPSVPKLGKKRNALLKAITEAQQHLSGEHLPVKRTAQTSKRREPHTQRGQPRE